MAKAKKSKPAAKKHKEKPTSARLLKNRPHDPPEPPEMPDNENEAAEAAGEETEGEQLETPDNPKPKRERPRQARLPGVEDPEIEELESAAEEYADVRDRRMALTKEEVRLQGELLTTMKKYDKTSYVHDGYDLKLVAEKEKVKVKIAKDKD